MDTRYVQHRMSNDGPTYCVVSEEDARWKVQDVRGYLLVLPKSEYVLCDPPGRWVDVTDECEPKISALNRQQIWHKDVCIDGANGYRFRKVTLYKQAPSLLSCTALLVEHRQP